MAEEFPIERVWVDIETPGLDAKLDPILEIGIALTDRWGNLIDREAWYVGDERTAQAIEERGKTDDFVNAMHTKSQLWDDWYKAFDRLGDEMSYESVDAEITEWLDNSGVVINKFPMCGSSVRFDRERVALWLPDTEAHFHYRIIDISTVKELCKDLNPRVYAGLDEQATKREIHRPLHDLVDTVKEYQYYVDNFLWVGEDA